MAHNSEPANPPPNPRRRHHTGDGHYFCPICNEPVKLETAKTDHDGKAVHDDCYLAKISGKVPPKPAARTRFSSNSPRAAGLES